MERIVQQLKVKAEVTSDNTLLRDTISFLLDIQRNPDGPHPISWDAIHRDFKQLQDRGLWEPTDENEELLDALRIYLNATSAKTTGATQPHSRHSMESGRGSSGNKLLIAVPSTQAVTSQIITRRDPLVLPLELVDVLNNAYLLHLLANDSSQVLPPGKSLLSAMSRSRSSDEDTKPTLHRKVEDIVHKAFWDEAVKMLSNPEPSSQLSRLKLLYGDLHIALSPLLPPKHPVLVTLSSPLSPTSSPLDSAVMHLREILASLHERCAPVRDPEIEVLLRALDDPPVRSSRLVALARLVSDTVQSVLKLSEVMKEDLSQFVLGSMTEEQLRSVVTKQAKRTEREITLDVWRRDRMAQAWSSWIASLQPHFTVTGAAAEPRFSWIARLTQSLGSTSSVSCTLPTVTIQTSQAPPSDSINGADTSSTSETNSNVLPPIFFFTTPELLKMQNYLQALVIAASLRSLTRLPVPSGLTDPNTSSFTQRVWTLLRTEIAEEPGAGETKLINLADEVVRARTQGNSSRQMPPLPAEEEVNLRAAVDRTLKPHDPVYVLLQNRLLTALVNALVNALVRRRSDGAAAGASGGPDIPDKLKTGRNGGRVGKRPRLVLDPEDMDYTGPRVPSASEARLVADIKGFEDPVLAQAVAEVFGKLDSCVMWVESIWPDVIKNES
ncbi:hypothetical protein F5I97DRAFT_1853777 [Phlebopus sp. FC_14]|nr:hypothetical protein F5I97DRAFT_1853777 [Phlebopus sp. FC_14]